MKSTVETREPVKLLCVRKPCTNPEDVGSVANNAISLVESRMPRKADGKPLLTGRKCYGIFTGKEYIAGVAFREGDNAKALGLEEFEIPGGKYARTTIKDLPNHAQYIGPAFDELAQTYTSDPTRHFVEFYRSHLEVVLLMPVK
ncbi:MAG TPA: GyrI-like domain-containing protein [Candidatus Nanoarchaeia archaeon]|nr:GyrI-like domain-containing protein [Candidatus Nanoarchaeia archaeon]